MYSPGSCTIHGFSSPCLLQHRDVCSACFLQCMHLLHQLLEHGCFCSARMLEHVVARATSGSQQLPRACQHGRWRSSVSGGPPRCAQLFSVPWKTGSSGWHRCSTTARTLLCREPLGFGALHGEEVSSQGCVSAVVVVAAPYSCHSYLLYGSVCLSLADPLFQLIISYIKLSPFKLLCGFALLIGP